MAKGFNRAEFIDELLRIFEPAEVQKRPCIFLSHKKEDKEDCRKIAEYFKNAELDYYLDELDGTLQTASDNNNAEEITACIKKAIKKSTHMMVVVSQKTFKSQWVPFEVGYGHALIIENVDGNIEESDKIKLAILTLKDLSEEKLPDFMKVGYILRGTKSLNTYISQLIGRKEESLIKEVRMFSHSTQQHPLDEILNWRL